MADNTPNTDEIERDLAQTRARMDRRLDELGERLAPNQLVNDALSHLSGDGGADFTGKLIAKAKANPIPATLVGAGILWLLASGETRRQRGEPDVATRLRSAEAGVVRLPDEHPDVHASRIDDARGQVLGIARNASDTAASYSQRIKDAVTSAGQHIRQTSHDLNDGASRIATGARSPNGSLIVIGAAAALGGLVAGALIPVSEPEKRALGGVADQLHATGRSMAQNAVDRAAHVAGEAIDAAKESAQAHGLTADRPVGEMLGDLKSGDLVAHVKQAAREVVDAGKDSLRSQMDA